MLEHYKINEAKSDLSEKPEPYPSETKRLIPAMKAYLHGRNLSYATANGNLWYPTDEVKERDPVPRIIIPAINKYQRPYWQGRAMLKHDLRYRSAKGGRFGSIVVVWPMVHSKEEIVLVEGPMDALAAAGLGFLSIATMGALFASYAVKFIKKVLPLDTTVIVVPDLDVPEFGVENVSVLSSANRKTVLRMPVGGKDLTEMSLNAREELLKI